MRRRDFITLLGGAAAWPVAAHAQQAAKFPTIGFLGASTPSAMNQWVTAFVQRLRELGWVEGRAIAIEYRWAEDRYDRYPELVADLIRRKVSVIATGASGPAAFAAKAATSSIPIVFGVGEDPVRQHLKSTGVAARWGSADIPPGEAEGVGARHGCCLRRQRC
jgi:putative ABC transport system substrate-binding protein